MLKATQRFSGSCLNVDFRNACGTGLMTLWVDGKMHVKCEFHGGLFAGRLDSGVSLVLGCCNSRCQAQGRNCKKPQNKQNKAGICGFFFGFSAFQVNQWCLEQMEMASNKKDDFLFRGDLFTSTLERWMPQKQFVFKWWFYYTIFDNDLGIRDMLLSDPVTYLYIYFGDLHISYLFVSFRSILFGSISGLASVALKFLKSSEAPERCCYTEALGSFGTSFETHHAGSDTRFAISNDKTSKPWNWSNALAAEPPDEFKP